MCCARVGVSNTTFSIILCGEHTLRPFKLRADDDDGDDDDDVLPFCQSNIPFQFEIFKKFMKILKYFKTLFEIFLKLLIFNVKWLKTFKNTIKVYKVSRRYMMLFMHNNKYLPLTGFDLLTLLQWTILKHREFLKYFRNISWNISRQKISRNFTSLYLTNDHCINSKSISCSSNLLLNFRVSPSIWYYPHGQKTFRTQHKFIY